MACSNAPTRLIGCVSRTPTNPASGRVRLAKVFCLPVGMLATNARAKASTARRAASGSPEVWGGGGAAAGVVERRVDVHGGVAVESGRVELQGADHAGGRVLVLVGPLVVVDRGVVVVL